MKLLVLTLIIPILPFLLVLFKKRTHSDFFKEWFSEVCIYLMCLIRGSALAYIAILMGFTAVCSIIKTIELNLITSLDIHLKIFIVAWTLSFIVTGFKKPVINEVT